MPFLRKELENALRIDVVWDRYLDNSLKSLTREKRGGASSRMKVKNDSKMPKGWQNFLHNNDNKEELFCLFSQKSVNWHTENFKEVYSTDGCPVLTNSSANDTSALSPCNHHEEADTRMMVHVGDAVNKGHSRILIRSVDSDVVVLAV